MPFFSFDDILTEVYQDLFPIHAQQHTQNNETQQIATGNGLTESMMVITGSEDLFQMHM
jgi:hypothetical protein